MATRRAAQTVVRKDIQRVLKEWRGAVKVWCDKLGGDDIPWWYNERSSVSILAVAIWKAGGVALEEYAADKGKKKKHWKGRGDLFIKLNGQKYILEAKQKWVSLSARAQITKERLKSTVKAAKKAVLETRLNGGRRLACVFFVPYISIREKRLMNGRVGLLITVLKHMEKAYRVNTAWFFPKETHWDFRHEGYIYPGIAILIRPLRLDARSRD
jgi:hypothetical protein